MDHILTQWEVPNPDGIEEVEEVDLFSWWDEACETASRQQSTSSSSSSQHFSMDSVNSGADEFVWLGHCEEEGLALLCVESMFTSTKSDKGLEEITTHPVSERLSSGVYESRTVFQADTDDNLKPKLLLEIDVVTEKKDSYWVKSHIEKVFEGLADVLGGHNYGGGLIIPLKIRKTKFCQRFDPLSLSIRSAPQYSIRHVTFPGRSADDAWRFAVLIRILGFILESVTENKVMTKRDLFYKDVKLFRKQSVVDTIVDDIAYTFGVERGTLNIVAAAKGLVCGNLRLYLNTGDIVECWNDREVGMLIPGVKAIDRIEILDTQWVLVIEKEATFRALATNRFWDNCTSGKGILITGKGYPDISTREFLRLLSVNSQPKTSTNSEPVTRPRFSIHAIVDYDPHGLSILSTYKFGSISLAHENHRLVVGEVQLLGIKSDDFATGMSRINEDNEQGILPLTYTDRRKAMKMLGKRYIWSQEDWRRELQRMLFMNMKAEIQVMDVGNRGGLESYLNVKLRVCS